MRTTTTLFLLACFAPGCAGGSSDAQENPSETGAGDGGEGDTLRADGDARAIDDSSAPPSPDVGSNAEATTDADDASTSDAATPDAGSPCGPTFTTVTGQKVITSGGTYANLIVASTDSDTPAIVIATAEPVVLRCIAGSGPGDFVRGGSDVTIDRSKYVGTTPTRDNVAPGKFYRGSGPKNVVIERSYMEHTGGIQVQSFTGDGSASQTIRVRYNDAVNIDGRFRNGGHEYESFVAVQDGKRSSAEITYNRTVTAPGLGHAEDNITMYKNGGTAARPFRVANNYIEGSYPDDYLAHSTTGTAINCDGDSLTTDDNMPQYGEWTNNFATGGAAINMPVGRYVTANDNTIVSVGRTRGGVRYRSGSAGFSLWNYLPTPMWGHNGGDRNRVLWLRDESPVTKDSPYSSNRMDIDLGAEYLTHTESLTLPYDTAEQWCYDEYMKMIAKDGVTIGPGW